MLNDPVYDLMVQTPHSTSPKLRKEILSPPTTFLKTRVRHIRRWKKYILEEMKTVYYPIY